MRDEWLDKYLNAEELHRINEELHEINKRLKIRAVRSHIERIWRRAEALLFL